MIRQIFIIGLLALFEFALKNVLHAYQMKSTLNKKKCNSEFDISYLYL